MRRRCKVANGTKELTSRTHTVSSACVLRDGITNLFVATSLGFSGLVAFRAVENQYVRLISGSDFEKKYQEASDDAEQAHVDAVFQRSFFQFVHVDAVRLTFLAERRWWSRLRTRDPQAAGLLGQAPAPAYRRGSIASCSARPVLSRQRAPNQRIFQFTSSTTAKGRSVIVLFPPSAIAKTSTLTSVPGTSVASARNSCGTGISVASGGRSTLNT